MNAKLLMAFNPNVHLKVNVKLKAIPIGIIILVILGLSIYPWGKVREGASFFDNFEGYATNHLLEKSYTVWRSGADLDVSIVSSPVYSGKKAMQVKLNKPNEVNGSINGSIYHNLHISSRNWNGATAIRYWIDNPGSGLRMNINFKEQYNEYWAIGSQGPFFLQSVSGELTQLDVYYDNIDIPSGYRGFVIVPLVSFSVPVWNTAIGNGEMELGQIESFAIGVTLPAELPQVFTVDDFEILKNYSLFEIDISGNQIISVPESGTRTESFLTKIRDLTTGEVLPASVSWSILESPDPAITLDAAGNLSIPNGSTTGKLTLEVVAEVAGTRIVRHFMVRVYGIAPMPSEETQTISLAPQPPMSEYDRFSQEFEVWAVQNRTLFVIAIIAVLIVLVAFLSRIERGLK